MHHHGIKCWCSLVNKVHRCISESNFWSGLEETIWWLWSLPGGDRFLNLTMLNYGDLVPSYSPLSQRVISCGKHWHLVVMLCIVETRVWKCDLFLLLWRQFSIRDTPLSCHAKKLMLSSFILLNLPIIMLEAAVFVLSDCPNVRFSSSDYH